MSKPVRECVKCEQCDRMIVLVSPPSDEQYRHGQIWIREGNILLDNLEVAGERHAANLDGYYCGPTCLEERIRFLRRVQKRRPA